MDDEDDGTPFWLIRRPFLEPHYPHPLPPRDDED